MTSQGNIYIVQIDGQKRKVIDLETLLIFIEQKKHEASLLNLDPSSMEFDDSLFKHIATHALDGLNEIEEVCKEALGLNQVEEPIHDDVEAEMSDDIMPEDDPIEDVLPEEIKEFAKSEADKIVDAEELPIKPEPSEDEDEDKIVL